MPFVEKKLTKKDRAQGMTSHLQYEHPKNYEDLRAEVQSLYDKLRGLADHYHNLAKDKVAAAYCILMMCDLARILGKDVPKKYGTWLREAFEAAEKKNQSK